MNSSDTYNWFIRHESAVPWLYKDTTNNVTCGIGCMVPTVQELAKWSWTPNLAYAQADWETLKGLPAGKLAAFYESHTRARLSLQQMQSRLFVTLDALRRQLQGWNISQLPEPIQLGLLDLAFNLGVGGLSKYEKLRQAIQARDWTLAAQESHRVGIGDQRNQETAALFLSCK